MPSVKYFQASVPFGVMMGYIIASVITELARGSATCYSLLCWRWAFLLEVALIAPLSVAMFFIPKELISVKVIHGNSARRKQIAPMQSNSILRSYSANSVGDRKDRVRSNISTHPESPPNQQFKMRTLFQNRYLPGPPSSIFVNHKSPMTPFRADSDHQHMKISNSAEYTEKPIYGSVGTTRNRPLSARTGTEHSRTSADTIKGHKSVPDVDYIIYSKDTIILNLPTAMVESDITPQHLSPLKDSQGKNTNGFEFAYRGLDIPFISRGRSYDELTMLGSDEIVDSSDEENSDKNRNEAFSTPADRADRCLRRRLRNQVSATCYKC